MLANNIYRIIDRWSVNFCNQHYIFARCISALTFFLFLVFKLIVSNNILDTIGWLKAKENILEKPGPKNGNYQPAWRKRGDFIAQTFCERGGRSRVDDDDETDSSKLQETIWP